MPHIHWVALQNKLEIPKDKDEVNKQDIHEYDGRAYDPDTMVDPLTPKPKRKAEALTRAPPTIASSREEDAALKKWPNPRSRCCECPIRWCVVTTVTLGISLLFIMNLESES